MGEWDINASISGTALKQFHIRNGGRVRNLFHHVLPLITIFILNLIDEYIASIGHLMLSDDFGHLGEVRGPSIRVSGIVVSQSAIGSSCEPSGKPACSRFGVDVRPWTE